MGGGCAPNPWPSIGGTLCAVFCHNTRKRTRGRRRLFIETSLKFKFRNQRVEPNLCPHAQDEDASSVASRDSSKSSQVSRPNLAQYITPDELQVRGPYSMTHEIQESLSGVRGKLLIPEKMLERPSAAISKITAPKQLLNRPAEVIKGCWAPNQTSQGDAPFGEAAGGQGDIKFLPRLSKFFQKFVSIVCRKPVDRFVPNRLLILRNIWHGKTNRCASYFHNVIVRQ